MKHRYKLNCFEKPIAPNWRDNGAVAFFYFIAPNVNNMNSTQQKP